jgi:catechol 2,3-dioxygenase-like lactoylglutathione lyase family enzyme
MIEPPRRQEQRAMGIGITELNHVNVTVPQSAEEAAKHFYDSVLGLKQIPKPEGSRVSVGAWYQLAGVQLHLSVEEGVGDNRKSTRHVCIMVEDLAGAELHLREAGVEILPDARPVRGWLRFYVRDPGGNLIEIAEREN